MSRQVAAAAPVAESAQPAPRPRAPVAAAEPAMQSSAIAIGAFAGLPAGNVSDADARRALATRLLIDQLAPALGLDPSRIRIRCDGGTAARLDAAGASGLQEGASILLHPARFRPETREGRGLLAHEAAHVAQRLLPGPSDEAGAEREAAAIADAVAQGRHPLRPVVPLRTLRAAADRGALQQVEAPKPAPPEAVPVLDAQVVATSRSREIAAIKRALSGWWISDGDVFRVLEILETVPHAVIEPLLGNLPEGDRYALCDNINPPHVQRYRRTTLACYQRTLRDSRLRDAVDLKVFRSLPMAGLTTVERETAAWVLTRLSEDQRLELLASDNGPAIAHIMGAPLPSAQELKRIQDEADAAARAEAQLYDKRRAAEAAGKDKAVAADLDNIKALLTEIGDAGSARQALEVLGQGGTETARFQFLAEQLEALGLADRLIALLPVDTLFEAPGHSQVLFALVRSRLPSKNEELIERLLSYRALDWAITDQDALFAYRLIKSLPLTAQHRFRLRDGGKWYLRLLENLPTDPSTQRAYPGLEIRRAETREEIEALRKSGATQVDEEALLFNASELQEKRLQREGATSLLIDLIRAFEEAERGIFRDREAIDLYNRVAAIGRSVLTTKMNEHTGEPVKVDKPADRLLREAIVHELDRLGHIDRLFDNLPHSFLFAEENRLDTVQIMLARDATRVREHARMLVSRGLLDWMVTDGEAWLAYQCVKALPPDEREAFIAEQPDEWSRILGEMSASQKQARDLNLYVGDKAGTDRGSVLGQLAVGETWTDANAGMVANLVRMAIAMTEHRFAFDRSREFKAHEKPKLAALVDKFRLWHPVQRPDYTPELLKGTRWYEEGPFATLRQLWGGLVTIAGMEVLVVRGGGVGIRADLGDVQKMLGGDLFGAQLADPKKRGADQPLPHPEANKVSLIVGPDMKSAELRLPELELATGNIQTGGTTIQFGRLLLRGLKLGASYAGSERDQPIQASAEVASVEVEDLMLAKTASMLAIGRLAISALRAAAATVDAVTRQADAPRKEFAFPFLLLVPHLIGLLAVAALPVYLYQKISGLLAQGHDKGLTDQFADDVAQRAKSISFTLGSLDVDNVTTSGGQHVGNVGLRDFSVQVGLNRATRLRAERGSVLARLRALEAKPEAAAAKAALQTRLGELDRGLEAVAADEREYVTIMNQIRGGGLSPERQKTLQARLDALHFEDEGKLFIDIGAIEASGVQGLVTAKEPIRITGVHGEGGGAALNRFIALPTVTDAELSRRSAAEERPNFPIEEGQTSDFHLDIGDIRTGEIRVGKALRTVADIDAEMEKLAPRRSQEAVKPLYESLELLRPKAERYERMVQHGVSALDARQLGEFRALRRDLAAQADLIVQSIEILDARLDVDAATGAVGFGASSVKVRGLDAPGTGIQIDEVIVRGLGMRAVPKGGLLGFADWRANLRDLGAGVDSLEISGARSRYHGLLFEKATLTGGYARMRNRGDKVELGLKRLSVENVGIAPRIGLLQQKLDGLRAKAKQADKAEKSRLDTEITTLEGIVTGLRQLVDARLAAYAALQAAKTPDEIRAAKDKVIEVDSTIAIGLSQFGATEVSLDDFGVAVTGAGDVLSDALGPGVDPLAILRRSRRGVTFEGTGPDKRVFRSFAVRGGQMASDAPANQNKSLAGEVGSFEIGETKLNASAGMEGKSIRIKVPQFNLAAMTVDQFLFTAAEMQGGMQLWSEGKSGIEGVRFAGSVRLDPKVEKPADLGDYALAQLQVDSFRIDAIRGKGLGIIVPEKKLEVSIKSGAVTGIYAEGLNLDLPKEAEALPVVTGKVGIEAIDDVVIGNAIAKGWQVSGKIRAKKIEASFLKDGEIEAGIGALSLFGISARGPDGWVRFSLADLGLNVHYKNGVLNVRDFHIGRLEVPAIHWRAGAKGMVDADKPVVLTGLRLSGLVEAAKPTADGKAPANPIGRIEIRKLHVDGFEASHLTYHDDEYTVTIGREQWDLPKYRQGFKGLELKNLDVWDLEWKPGGLTKGHATLGSYEASADVEGVKSALKAGVVLRGGGLKGEVKGPGIFEVDIGRLKEMRGDYGDGKISTRFGSGAVTGAVAFGPNFIEARDFVIEDLALAKTSYTDGPLKLSLKTFLIEKVKIGKARLEFKEGGDPANPDAKALSKLTIADVEFLDTTADTFSYEGSSTARTPDGKDVTAMQQIKAGRATMKRLALGTITHDAATAATVISGFKVDAGEKPRSYDRPFAIRNLSATFVSGIGDKPTTTKLVTDVEAGPLVGDKIVFDTVRLGTTPDGKPVTRTRIDGAFTLSRLGLINPNLTITDAKGETHLGPTGYGTIELLGIKPRFLPNGTMLLPIDAMVAKNLKLKRGDMEVAIPFAKISDIAVGLEGMGTKEGIDLIGARLKEIKVEGLHFTLRKVTKASLTPAEHAAAVAEWEANRKEAAANPPARLVAEPLSGLEGEAEGEFDIPYWFNTRIGVEVEEGIADPDVADPTMPGLSLLASWLIPDQNIRNLVEGFVNDPSERPKRTNDPKWYLNHLRMKGAFGLGQGRIGMDEDRNGKLGDGDYWAELSRTKPHQNKIALLDSVIGKDLRLRMAELYAGKAGFAAGKTKAGKKRLGTTGPISVLGIAIQVRGLGALDLHLSIYVREGKIENIKIGDAQLLNPADLLNRPAPSAKDVDPTAIPEPVK